MAPTDRVPLVEKLPAQTTLLVYLSIPLQLFIVIFLIRRYAWSRPSARVNQDESSSVSRQEKVVEDVRGNRNDMQYTTGAHTTPNISSQEYYDFPVPSARILDEDESVTLEPQTYQHSASAETNRQVTNAGVSSDHSILEAPQNMEYWQMQKTIDYTQESPRERPQPSVSPRSQAEDKQAHHHHAMIQRETTQIFPGGDKRQFSRRRILEFS